VSPVPIFRAKRSAFETPPDDKINFLSFITPESPPRGAEISSFTEYLPDGCAEQLDAIIHRVLRDTRSTSTVVKGRKREAEEVPRRGVESAFLPRRTIMRADTRLCMALCAEIYVSGDTFLSA